MRDYGKVYTAFWTSEDARGFSEDGRMLSLYLMTCPHGNMLGCFRLPDAYAAEDLKWSTERVSKGFDELFQKGFAYRCNTSFWVFLKQYLKWNKFDNPNVGKAAGKMFDSISPPHTVRALLVKALREFDEFFPPKKLADFETLSIPFANPFETVSKPVVVAVPVVVAIAVAETVANPIVELKPDESVQTIFDYWRKMMQSPGSVLDKKRVKFISDALKNYSPADVCKAIRGCSKSPHNMGDNQQKTKYNGLNLILRDAEHIDRFIALDAGNARPASETFEQHNARVTAEFLGTPQDDDNTIEMEV